ncbi:hypothetical protein HDU87_003628 [Geranomyces variabilis]|uniref:RING-type domain-containing protein n=1 Tax=Geranomyces variabilis TaxID=109894 RepID=A0AAD5XSG1_9FUNG|nr:hypothetical protein HDU87_003628 [Geranomyces variabilis]
MSQSQENDPHNNQSSLGHSNQIDEETAGNAAAAGEAAASSAPSAGTSDGGDMPEQADSPRGAHGRTISFVFMSDDTESSIDLVRMLSGLSGDFGPGVLLLSRLAALMTAVGDHQHTQGQPPASKACIDELMAKTFQLFAKRLAKHPRCTICQEEFSLTRAPSDGAPEGQDVARLDCHHLFHIECISQWLGNSATCPTCRYEMLTDNEDYNVGVRKRMAKWDLGADTDDEEEGSSVSSETSEVGGSLATAAAAAEPENQLKRDRGEEECPRHGSSGRSSRARF